MGNCEKVCSEDIALLKHCEDCLFFNSETSVCHYHKKNVTALSFACPFWAGESYVCESCGRTFAYERCFLVKDDEFMILCPECDANHGRCGTCKESSYCAFRDDNECQLPHTVQVKRQEGPMVILQEAPNPARIEATCKAKCKCYNAEYNGCCRGLGSCINFEVRKVDRNV